MVRAAAAGVLGIGLLAGCVADRGRPADSWNRVSPLVFHDGGPGVVESVPFAVVSANEAEAVARLNDREWVELTADEAARYLVRPVDGSGRLFLLRATCLKGDPGWFDVRRLKDRGYVQVQFHFTGTGPKTRETVRRAVIARLTAPPAELFPDEFVAKTD